ncbi:MAG: type II toxin-antitoxin system PemK/MazF family toxin [Planctomycetes bacterium]|nr:type II toxin-antitoxin system PemK/MazF family toxin [Planctomycetota bacterium]
MERGSVYLVRLDPVEGSEQGNTRPCLVVSNDVNNRVAPTVTVLPISSRIPSTAYPFLVFLERGAGGLDRPSVAKANQIRTIDKRRLLRRLGNLDARQMVDVDQAIQVHLALR